MSFPLDIYIGSYIIPIHAVLEFFAFAVGYQYFLYRKRNGQPDPLPRDKEWWIIVGMAAGALVLSRLVAALENPELFFSNPGILYYVSGQTITGGLVGGIIGVEIAKKILGIKRKTGDLFVYPLILAMIIGRIGCFLTGVTDGTVGLVCNLPWCLDQGDGLLRHPTSLYEIGFLILAWLSIKWIEKRNGAKQGDLFSLFIFGYSVFRFIAEFIKPRHELWIGLSSIQLLMFMVMLYYFVYFILRYRKTNT